MTTNLSFLFLCLCVLCFFCLPFFEPVNKSTELCIVYMNLYFLLSDRLRLGDGVPTHSKNRWWQTCRQSFLALAKQPAGGRHPPLRCFSHWIPVARDLSSLLWQVSPPDTPSRSPVSPQETPSGSPVNPQDMPLRFPANPKNTPSGSLVSPQDTPSGSPVSS